MNQLRTRGIVLTRIDFGEADRIITVLTPDHGKLSLIAKGVRRVRSKLAGAIELFSISEIVYVPGRGNLSTLISARLIKHYGKIVENIDRTMLGYDLLKLLNKVTEDAPEEAYFMLLDQALAALDEPLLPTELVRIWFSAQLLRLAGHTPNLTTAVDGMALSSGSQYDFDFEAVAFRESEAGKFGTNEIKFLRLLFTDVTPKTLSSIEGVGAYASALDAFMVMLRQNHLRV